MNFEEMYRMFDITKISNVYIEKMKNTKKTLSTNEKKYLKKILDKFRTTDKGEVLKGILFYSIWFPDECIEYARKKGVFRYQFGGEKLSNAKFYFQYLLKFREYFGYSADTLEYIRMKESCNWIHTFYVKTEKSIKRIIETHHHNRIRKNVNGIRVESTLFKELIVYMELIFTLEREEIGSTPNIKNKLTAYSKEEIGNAISYLIYLYDMTIGIKTSVNYWIDVHYIFSKDIEHLILLACQFIQIQEWEILIDCFGYKMVNENKTWRIVDTRDLEKSIRIGFAKLEMNDHSFFLERQEDENADISLRKLAEFTVKKLEKKIVNKIDGGFLSRYRIVFPEELLKIIQNEPGRVQFFKEELDVLQYMNSEMVSGIDVIRRKKITEHATLEDVLLFQRFFSLIMCIYEQILRSERDKKVYAASIGLVLPYSQIFKIVDGIIKNREKTQELLELFTYNKSYKKLDLQYTPIIRVGDNLYFSAAIIAMSNMMRNAIAYSHMIKNQVVNKDNGIESLVELCKQSFLNSAEKCQVFTNRKFKFCNRQGEIDVLVITDSYLLIIECKAPLRPTNNFELRSEYTHIQKAQKQLDISKKAFSDKAFRIKYLNGLGVKESNREIMTCILLGNRVFTGYVGCGHPIRAFHELDAILNNGHMAGSLGRWRIWKEDHYSSDDLKDFLSEDKSAIRILEKAAEKRSEVLIWKDKNIEFETYSYNVLKAHRAIDERYKCVYKTSEWDKYMESFVDNK